MAFDSTAGSGEWRERSSSATNFAEGTAGDDVLVGSPDLDLLSDRLGGNDQLYGEGGGDHLYVSRGHGVAGSALLDGGADNDRITYANSVHEGAAVLIGGEGADYIETSGGADVTIDAGAGADVILLDHEGTRYTITLGSESDLISFTGVNWTWQPGPALVIADFEPGAGGDRLDLERFLAKFAYDFYANPFATGHLLLVQRGADAVLQADRLGNGAVIDLVVFEGVDAATLTHDNLGFSPDGTDTPGRHFAGSADDDLFFGTGGDDLIEGFDGQDHLYGGSGNDVLEGGAEGDRLEGQTGDDILRGGIGADHLWEEMGGNDQLFGGADNDTIHVTRRTQAPPSILLLDGGDGPDAIYFNGSTSRLGDQLTIIGGAGADHISIDGGPFVTIDAGEGDDDLSLILRESDYTITLGSGADRVSVGNYGFAANWAGRIRFTDFSTGDAGDRLELQRSLLSGKLAAWDRVSNPFSTGDLRLAQRGADTLLQMDRTGGSDSYETLFIFTASVASSFTAFNLGGYAPGLIAIIGTESDDVLRGGAHADVIDGLGGSDLLDGGAGADRLEGGTGSDIYYVDSLADVVIERPDEGRDVVYSTVDYTLAADQHVEVLSARGHAGTAPIALTGNALAQEIWGNAGDNVIRTGGGADILVGLGGNDIYYIDLAGVRIVEGAGAGFDTVSAARSCVLNAGAHVELLMAVTPGATNALRLTGNELAQEVRGNAGDNVLDGKGGDDALTGLSGADTLYGGFGNDLLDGGTGADRMEGGADNDTYYVDSTGDAVIERSNEGRDVVYSTVDYALTASQHIEVLSARGHAGTAPLALTGNSLTQEIWGNAGNNVLDGKGGNDTLVGLGGADTFAFTTVLGAGNVDRIVGFEVGIDRIGLDDAIFTGIGAALAASEFAIGAAAADADDRIIYDSATGRLLFDADGAGGAAAVQFATLNAGLGLTASDFTMI